MERKSNVRWSGNVAQHQNFRSAAFCQARYEEREAGVRCFFEEWQFRTSQQIGNSGGRSAVL